jgi:hypothetical protein
MKTETTTPTAVVFEGAVTGALRQRPSILPAIEAAW